MSANNNSTTIRPSGQAKLDADLISKGYAADIRQYTKDAFNNVMACCRSQKEWITYYKNSWIEEKQARNADNAHYEKILPEMQSQIKETQDSHAAVIKQIYDSHQALLIRNENSLKQALAEMRSEVEQSQA